MRALIRMGDRELAESVERSLENLGFDFIKNQGLNVSEFEVHSPCHFIVSVENLSRQRFTFLLRSGVRIESAIEIKRLVGSDDSESKLRGCSAALVEDLRRNLPPEPWKGLGVFGSKIARNAWESMS